MPTKAPFCCCSACLRLFDVSKHYWRRWPRLMLWQYRQTNTLTYAPSLCSNTRPNCTLRSRNAKAIKSCVRFRGPLYIDRLRVRANETVSFYTTASTATRAEGSGRSLLKLAENTCKALLYTVQQRSMESGRCNVDAGGRFCVHVGANARDEISYHYNTRMCCTSRINFAL